MRACWHSKYCEAHPEGYRDKQGARDHGWVPPHGADVRPIIEPTITELKKINPNMVIPMHCTGWKAINQFAKEMPQQFILNSVGTTYTFK